MTRDASVDDEDDGEEEEEEEEKDDVDDEEGRFEWRVWDDVDEAGSRLRDAGRRTGSSESTDTYLVGSNRATNAKVRAGRLEVKHLVETRGELQRWRPAWSAELPLAAAEVSRLFTELGLDSEPPTSAGSLDERHLRQAVADAPGGCSSTLHKARQHYEIGGVMAELTNVTAAGARRRTLAVESTDAALLARVARELHVSGPNEAMHLAAADMASPGRGGDGCG